MKPIIIQGKSTYIGYIFRLIEDTEYENMISKIII